MKDVNEFCNVSFLKMRYKFGDMYMIFFVVAEEDDLSKPFILYQVCVEEACRLVENGIGVWILDGKACVDEVQAVRGAPVQAPFVRKAFSYVEGTYRGLVEDGTVDRLRNGGASVGDHTWFRAAELGRADELMA